MNRPIPTNIFHITAIENLAKICAAGKIFSKNSLHTQNQSHQSIAHSSIQNRRAHKQVQCAPGGFIHDYVPFYFAPRSPMLFAIHKGNVAGCTLMQHDIVHIESTVERIADSGNSFVIYPISAALNYSLDCYNTLDGLHKINWPMLFDAPHIGGYAQFFHSLPNREGYEQRLETRQAEFLVHQHVDLNLITRIGVANEAKRNEVAHILAQNGVKLEVDVQSDWYF